MLGLRVFEDHTPEAGPRQGGADALFPDPLQLCHPAAPALPVVLASPHSGRLYPLEFLAASKLDAVGIRRSEDAFIDELLWPAHERGCPLLAANFPRAYLDVNREPFELDPAMFADPLPAHMNTRSLRVTSGLGTIARIVREGVEIYRRKLTVAEAERRIRALYIPYHDTLARLLEETHAHFGCAVLIDVHSMPSLPPMSAMADLRADIVLGDRFGAACHPEIIRAAEAVFRRLGYRVKRNQPYAGGFSTEHYGRPRLGFHALQIEINRALYMDEERIERRPRAMAILGAHMAEAVEAIGTTELNALRASSAA
ncbi:MAG: N-formylglutamate amidohydrolase [Alphaproteobacteria bacterium]|nr:N-formylglutamate amidohydrolase [Alphaproteobacteria bacterium]